MRKSAFVMLALALFAGCENVDKNLHEQIYVKIQKSPNIIPPDGAVPVLGSRRKVDYSAADPARLHPPFPLDQTAAGRGKRLFAIYCVPCHGPAGEADTRIAKKMDTKPADLTNDRSMTLTDGDIFVKILASDLTMPQYRNELEDAQAWDIVAYVRILQAKQGME
ncbi:MAG: cytochrome c [Nitrospinae bacterium]|nr:cytochrome c [Nitrospinota bacterium]